MKINKLKNRHDNKVKSRDCLMQILPMNKNLF